MRIHVWLAKHTKLSRRKAEMQVSEKRVTINHKTAEIGQAVESGDVVHLDGVRIRAVQSERRIVALHKPEGYVCSHRPQGDELSVFNLLPEYTHTKWILVGRLDINTCGLLLVTNDGNLANQLAHPSTGLEREYLVRVNSKLSSEIIAQLKQGVMLDDGWAKFSHITLQPKQKEGRNTWYKVTLDEGRNRIVRRLMESQGVLVNRLMRVRFGPFKLDKALGVGKFQDISPQWVDQYLANK